MHRFLDEDRSVSAEVINAIIEKGTSHIAYLKGDNVVPSMKVLFAQINGTAVVRDRTELGDLEDVDLLPLFRKYFKCCCSLCTRGIGTWPTSVHEVRTTIATEYLCTPDKTNTSHWRHWNKLWHNEHYKRTLKRKMLTTINMNNTFNMTVRCDVEAHAQIDGDGGGCERTRGRLHRSLNC